MSNAVKLVNFLNDSGIFALVVVIIYGWFSKINPTLKTKIDSNKSAKQRQLLSIIDTLALNTVTKISTMYELPSDEKRLKAIGDLENQVESFNHKVDPEIISAAIERAYQLITTENLKSQKKQKEYNDSLKATEEKFLDDYKNDIPVIPEKSAPVEGGQDNA